VTVAGTGYTEIGGNGIVFLTGFSVQKSATCLGRRTFFFGLVGVAAAPKQPVVEVGNSKPAPKGALILRH
jgi:hypothetical protein